MMDVVKAINFVFLTAISQTIQCQTILTVVVGFVFIRVVAVVFL